MYAVSLFGLFIVCGVGTVVGDLPTACSDIVAKKKWNGRAAVKLEYCIIPVEYVVVHQTVTPVCTTEDACAKRVRSIQDYHMNSLDFRDVGYNFLVGGDGKIYEGAGWHKVGAHTKKYNQISLGLGFIGDFSSVKPVQKQLQAAKTFLDCAVELGEIDVNYKLIGASQVRRTASPGQKLLEEIQNWSHYYAHPPTAY